MGAVHFPKRLTRATCGGPNRAPPAGIAGPEAPDLVVEVLSPSTARCDLGVKGDIYERSRVREYCLVGPHRRENRGLRARNPRDRFG
jgi:Uma2 family endonuclease